MSIVSGGWAALGPKRRNFREAWLCVLGKSEVVLYSENEMPLTYS